MPVRARFQLDLTLPVGFVAVIWLVWIIDRLLPFIRLSQYGIRPRSMDGLVGILFAPLLHAGLFHLAANTVPILVLLVLLELQSQRRMIEVLAAIWLLTGAAVWVIGRGYSVHIGASGLVYGLVTYLIAAGFYLRDWRSVLIGAFVLFTYGAMLWRIFPTLYFISWESHLCGAAVGVMVASWSGRQERRRRA